MSDYPAGYDTFRTPANEPGIDFDAGQLTTIFSEDFGERSDAIVAIEQTLGINPQGSYDTVADRLAAGGGGGGGGSNLDGGFADEDYGGTTALDGGGA